MGMKLAKITYHLERAAIARADHAAGRPVNQGSLRYGSHLDRAAMHEDLAAGYLVDGLQQYARLADNPNARWARRNNKRIHAGGPGRGRKAAHGWVSLGGRGGFVKSKD